MGERTRRILTLSSAGVVAVVVVTGGYLLFKTAFGTPDYSCTPPDPTPLADVGSPNVLQECATRKSITISRGSTIAVDLQNSYGVDTYMEWRDVSAADASVLETVKAPERIGIRPRSDEVAVYAGLRTGVSDVTAVQYACGALNCGGGARWKVTVHVT